MRLPVCGWRSFIFCLPWWNTGFHSATLIPSFLDLVCCSSVKVTLFQSIKSRQREEKRSAHVLMSSSTVQRQERKDGCLTPGGGNLKFDFLQLNFAHHIDLFCVYYGAVCLSQWANELIPLPPICFTPAGSHIYLLRKLSFLINLIILLCYLTFCHCWNVSYRLLTHAESVVESSSSVTELNQWKVH